MLSSARQKAFVLLVHSPVHFRLIRAKEVRQPETSNHIMMVREVHKMATRLRVWIDRDDCISCARCWTTCPEFFEQNPDDLYSQVVEPHRSDGALGEGRASEALRDCVTGAADDCPVQIIHVEAL